MTTFDAPVLGRLLAPIDDAEALQVVLDGWRLWREPRLARLVNVLSNRLVLARGTIPGLSHKDRAAGWVSTASERDPSQLGRLLPSLGGASAKIAHKNLLLLAGWPDDPRLTGRLHELIQRPRVSGGSSRFFWTLVFEVLNRIVDPRTIPVLNALIDSPVLFASTLQAPFARRAATVVEHLRQTLYLLERIPDDELAVVSRVEKRFELPEVPTVSSATLEQLLEEVFALPGEDAPRQVYGDALMANGEPRGELIALQFARGRSGGVTTREYELLREHGPTWAGALRACCREVRFERGFPAAVVLKQPRWNMLRALSAREWATIEELDVGDLDGDPCIALLLENADLPMLRRVKGLTPEIAQGIHQSTKIEFVFEGAA